MDVSEKGIPIWQGLESSGPTSVSSRLDRLILEVRPVGAVSKSSKSVGCYSETSDSRAASGTLQSLLDPTISRIL